MPLNREQRLAMRNVLHPSADQRVLGPVDRALAQFIRPGSAVLDAGAGTGTWVLDRHVRRIRLAVGADVSFPDDDLAPAKAAPRKRSPVLADLASLPFSDAAFDVVICYNVIEHLPAPPAVFREFARLLNPAGVLVFKTPCLHSPTIIASNLLPFSWHQSIKRRLSAESQDDIFPTYYRCNTMTSLDCALTRAGLQRRILMTVDQTYDYLHFSRLTYGLGLVYSRMTTLPGLSWLGNAIIGVYTRQAIEPAQISHRGLTKTLVPGEHNAQEPLDRTATIRPERLD